MTDNRPFTLALLAALACAPVRLPPPGVAVVAGVCGGAVIGGRVLTASHCTDEGDIPIATATGLQLGEVASLHDARGEDLAWLWAGYPLGDGLAVGGPPKLGDQVAVWRASEGDWYGGTVVAVDERWRRARLSVIVRRGDSGSPVIRDGAWTCAIVGVDVRSGLSECSW